ncbi:hypothetical protein JCM8115_000743 [Rhodotorula mucilaginosa]
MHPRRTASAAARTAPFHPPANRDSFKDLLVFEERLKQNAQRLQKQRRKYEAFLLTLSAVIAYLGYSVFVLPSIYSLVHYSNVAMLLVAATTLVLFFATGMYSEKIAYAHKFVPQANRALRPFNIYLNTRRQSWFASSFLGKYFSPSPSSPGGGGASTSLSRTPSSVRSSNSSSSSSGMPPLSRQNSASSIASSASSSSGSGSGGFRSPPVSPPLSPVVALDLDVDTATEDAVHAFAKQRLSDRPRTPPPTTRTIESSTVNNPGPPSTTIKTSSAAATDTAVTRSLPPPPHSSPPTPTATAPSLLPSIPPAQNPRGELIFSSRVSPAFREGYERYRGEWERRRAEAKRRAKTKATQRVVGAGAKGGKNSSSWSVGLSWGGWFASGSGPSGSDQSAEAFGTPPPSSSSSAAATKLRLGDGEKAAVDDPAAADGVRAGDGNIGRGLFFICPCFFSFFCFPFCFLFLFFLVFLFLSLDFLRTKVLRRELVLFFPTIVFFNNNNNFLRILFYNHHHHAGTGGTGGLAAAALAAGFVFVTPNSSTQGVVQQAEEEEQEMALFCHYLSPPLH